MSEIIINGEIVTLDVVDNPVNATDYADAAAVNALITLQEVATDTATGLKSYASVVKGDVPSASAEPPKDHNQAIIDNLDNINAQCQKIQQSSLPDVVTEEAKNVTPMSTQSVLPDAIPPTPSTSPISSSGSFVSYGSDDGLDKPNPVQLRKAKNSYPPDITVPPPDYYPPGLTVSDGVTAQLQHPEIQIEKEVIHIDSDIDVESETKFMKGRRRQRRKRFLKRQNNQLHVKRALEQKHKRTAVPFVSIWDITGMVEDRKVRCRYCQTSLTNISYANLAHHHATCRQKAPPSVKNQIKLCIYDQNHHIPADQFTHHLLQCPSAPQDMDYDIPDSKSLEEDIMKRIEATCKLWHIAPSTGRANANFIKTIIQSFLSNQNISPEIDYKINTKAEFFMTKYPYISLRDIDLMYKQDHEHWWDTELSI